MLLVAHDGRAEEEVGVPVHGFGRAVNDDVGAKVERALQQRRSERVVDHAQDVPLAREGAQVRKVGDPEQRVRRRFEPQHVGPVTAIPEENASAWPPSSAPMTSSASHGGWPARA